MGDLSGAILSFAIVCAVIGGAIMSVLFYVVPWAWQMVKPWLHAITG